MITATTTDAVALKFIGQQIKSHRISKQLKQAELAEEAGISLPTLNRMEAGQSVQLVNLIRVLRCLDLLEGLADLLGQDETPNTKQRVRRKVEPKDQTPNTPWGA